MLTRRTLLTVGAAGVASLAMPKMAFASEKADVIVMGAGLSGLHSATMLRDLGFKVLVLEANNRVGGRICTVETRYGRQDVGASQIGRSYARVLDAVRRYKLKMVPQDRDLLKFSTHLQGHWIQPEAWETHPLNKTVGNERKVLPLAMGTDAVRKALPFSGLEDWTDPRYAEYDVSVRTLMQRMGYSGEAIRLAEINGIDGVSALRTMQETVRSRYDATTDNVADPTKDQSAHRNLPPVSNLVGGCDVLPKAMAADLGNAVRLNKRVARIEMTDTNATVTCADGSVYQANFLVSAIPFAVFRNVEIQAKPGGAAQQAINEMPYGNTSRLYFRIAKPFWKEDGLSPSFQTDTAMSQFWAIDNHTGDGEHRGMLVMSGKYADEITRNPEAEKFLVSEIERLRPAAKGLITVSAYKNWGADPLQGGCGFSLAPGQMNAFGRDMLKPWQVMHFAGEHTRRMDFGMESAMESAERVAFEIAERAA